MIDNDFWARCTKCLEMIDQADKFKPKTKCCGAESEYQWAGSAVHPLGSALLSGDGSELTNEEFCNELKDCCIGSVDTCA